jgi:hypothetical protein
MRHLALQMTFTVRWQVRGRANVPTWTVGAWWDGSKQSGLLVRLIAARDGRSRRAFRLHHDSRDLCFRMLVKQDVSHPRFAVTVEFIMLLFLIFAMLALINCRYQQQTKLSLCSRLVLCVSTTKLRSTGGVEVNFHAVQLPVQHLSLQQLCMCFVFMAFDEMWFRAATMKLTQYCSLTSSVASCLGSRRYCLLLLNSVVHYITHKSCSWNRIQAYFTL